MEDNTHTPEDLIDAGGDALMALADEYFQTLDSRRLPIPGMFSKFVISIPDVYEPVVVFTATLAFSGREITTAREMPQSMRDRTGFPEHRTP